MVISSCNSGYQKQNGQWVWITYDEYNGKRAHWMEDIDNESFQVSKVNKNFGIDRNHAYFQGRKINHATSDGFVPLTDNEYGYSKDKFRVFFDTEIILKANPNTFTVLEFPYSRDINDVYNGTLPMNLDKNDVISFRVTNDDKLMAGTKSTTLLTEFLKFSPEYHWIDSMDLDIKWIISGSYGTGESNGKRFKGFNRIN